MSRMAEFSDPDRLSELVDKLTDGGKLSHKFENGSIQNISKWLIAGQFPKEMMRIYGYPAENPLYIFILQRSDIQCPQLQVRTPTQGHDCAILEEALKEIVAIARPSMEQHGGDIVLEGDHVVRTTFYKLQETGELPLEPKLFEEFYPFYMNEAQKKALTEMELTLPEGFKIDKIDVEKEHMQIYKAWPYCDYEPAEMTRLRLAHLPTICVRDLEGNLVAWNMLNEFGQLTHLYVFEPYRSKGIGLTTQLLFLQKNVKNGFNSYKYLAPDNENVLRGSKRHPLWSQWRSTNEGGKEGEGDLLMWTFSIASLIKAK